MQHSYDSFDRPGGLHPSKPAGAPAPPRLRAAVGRADRLADRRRRVPGRDGVAGVRALERAHRALDGGHRDDRAHDRAAADRRRRHRPLRPPPGAAGRGRRARRGRRADGGAVADRDARALAHVRPGRALRRRHRVLRAGVRRDRARPAAGRRSWPRPTRSTSSCGRSAFRLAGPALGGWLAGAASASARPSRSTPARSRSRRRWCCAMSSRASRSAGEHSVVGRPAPGLPRSSAATCGCGARWCRPRSPTCCSWGRSRCCCPTWSRTACTAAPPALGLVFAAGGLGVGGRRPGDEPRRPAAPQHHASSTPPGRSRRWRSPATAWPTRPGS